MKHHLKRLVALLLAFLLTLSLAGVAEEATPNDEPVQVLDGPLSDLSSATDAEETPHEFGGNELLDPNSITAEESSDSASVSALVR